MSIQMNRVLGVLSLWALGCSGAADDGLERANLGTCDPGEVFACACPDQSLGEQACLPSGDAVEPCSCSPASGEAPPLGGGGAPPTGSTGGTAPTSGGVGGDVPPPDEPSAPPVGGAGGSDPGDPVEPVEPVEPGGAPIPPLAADHCLSGIANYSSTGPFQYTTARAGSVNIWVPNVPAGCKVPVVHLANGTGARCSTYGAILQHLASHGFLTACYENTNTGQGTQCLSAIQTVRSQYPDLADDKVGSTGHSQGGGGAIMCVYRVEQEFGTSIDVVGHAMEPAHGYGDAPSDYGSYYAQIRSPIFMFNGSADTLVSARWVGRGFNALDDGVEAYWYQAEGARHIPVPTRWTQESTVAWFRWKLLGDAQACEYFKNMPNTRDWSYRRSQNATACN
jgi:hypothetical protein